LGFRDIALTCLLPPLLLGLSWPPWPPGYATAGHYDGSVEVWEVVVLWWFNSNGVIMMVGCQVCVEELGGPGHSAPYHRRDPLWEMAGGRSVSSMGELHQRRTGTAPGPASVLQPAASGVRSPVYEHRRRWRDRDAASGSPSRSSGTSETWKTHDQVRVTSDCVLVMVKSIRDLVNQWSCPCHLGLCW